MNTSLTERGGLPLLAAWLAGASVCAVFALIACFALPVVFSAQGGQIFSWVWRPDTHEFGILPMIVGSLLLSVSALLLSWPLAVGVACAIQDGGKKRLFGCTIAGIVRFMTTIPTVVYGFAAVFLLVPVVREAAGKGSGLCWLSATLMLALLILPTMVLVMDSAMRTKERNVRITAAALGFTRSQTLACLVLPASRRWLLTAAILGFGRAAGDTLIPLMLTGNAPHVPESLFGSLRTLTAHMGLV
ncbi:PstC family ABC transporter permease, partial [Bilophila wadsworthia]